MDILYIVYRLIFKAVCVVIYNIQRLPRNERKENEWPLTFAPAHKTPPPLRVHHQEETDLMAVYYY